MKRNHHNVKVEGYPSDSVGTGVNSGYKKIIEWAGAKILDTRDLDR